MRGSKGWGKETAVSNCTEQPTYLPRGTGEYSKQASNARKALSIRSLCNCPYVLCSWLYPRTSVEIQEHEMCLPTFYTTHTKTAPYFSNRFTIDHNRQTYTVRDGVSLVLTLCSHYKLFLRPQFVHHRKHGLSHHDQSRLDIIIHLRTSSCEVRLILARTGINLRTLVKSRNMKFHANSRGGSGTTPC